MDTPLQLEQYFFPHVKVTADPGALETTMEASQDFTTGVDVLRTEDGENNYQVSLSIKSYPESEDKRTAYTVDLVAIGFFNVISKKHDPDKLLRVTGASILYAAAREFLITITSRGPWGPLMLPTTSFLTLHNKRQEAAKEDEEPKNEKTK